MTIDSKEIWAIHRNVRVTLASAMVLPVLILSLVEIGDWNPMLERLGVSYVNEYLMFTSFIIIIAIFLLKDFYRIWLFYFGFAAIFFVAATFIGYVQYWNSDKNRDFVDNVHITLFSIPIVSLAITLEFFWRKQNRLRPENSQSERIMGGLGLITSFVLMIAEFFPWIKSVFKATSETWKFKGSGKNTYIVECCYVTQFDLFGVLRSYIPLIGLVILFLITLLGYRFAILAFTPLVVWCAQKSFDFLVLLGVQDPLKIWTKGEVDSNGLSLENEGLFGGFLFLGASIFLILLLLLPRIIGGRSSAQRASL